MKGSGNSAFLQKDQLCYLKRAFIFHRTTCKVPTFFVNASRLGEKLKKRYLFTKKKSAGILSFQLKIFQRQHCPLFIHSHCTKPNARKCEKGAFFQFEAISLEARKKYLFCGLETFLSKEKKRYLFLRLQVRFSKVRKRNL